MLGPSPRWHSSGLRVIEVAAATPADLHGGTLLLGNYDGFHLGHQTLLTAGRGASGTFRTPLGVMSCEPHPKTFFSRGAAAFRLTTPSSKEIEIARYGFDFHYGPTFDEGFAGMSPEAFVTDVLKDGLNVSHVICGGDFRFGQARRGDASVLLRLGQDVGITVTVMAQADHGGARISSTRIRQALSDGQLGVAKSLLGRFWSFMAYVKDDGTLHVAPELTPLAAGRYNVTLRPQDSAEEKMGLMSVVDGVHLLEGNEMTDGPLEVTPLVRLK